MIVSYAIFLLGITLTAISSVGLWNDIQKIRDDKQKGKVK